MKSGKDEGKTSMDPPLFPRLHINDADKGGPRAPPRNKMASCEQYNVSSSSHIMPLPSHTTSTRPSSNHVESPKQNVFRLPGPSSHFALTERYRSYYSGGLNFNTTDSSSKPHSCYPVTYINNSGDDNNLRVPSFVQPLQESKRDCTSERIMRKPCSSPNILDDMNGMDNIESKQDCKERESVRVQNNVDKSEENSDTSETESVTGSDLTPDDVIRVIGQKLFWSARKTIMDQQSVFSMQIFELHRLIKVQRLIAGSPQVLLHENNFNLNKPSIKFPPMNKLLYVTPLDPSPVVTKPKSGTLKPNLISKDQDPVCTQVPINPIDSKLPPPFFFHPPPGNQWLVPVRSPSEGLIYKPYTGPCPPPTASIMAPVFGTIPGPRFSSQSYLQPYGMPLSVANLEPDPFDANISIPCRSSSGLVSEPSSPDRFQGDILSLFPTTPSIQVSKNKCNEQKVQVIKVVPHNPRLATESAARIFQSIQEERKKI